MGNMDDLEKVASAGAAALSVWDRFHNWWTKRQQDKAEEKARKAIEARIKFQERMNALNKQVEESEASIQRNLDRNKELLEKFKVKP